MIPLKNPIAGGIFEENAGFFLNKHLEGIPEIIAGGIPEKRRILDNSWKSLLRKCFKNPNDISRGAPKWIFWKFLEKLAEEFLKKLSEEFLRNLPKNQKKFFEISQVISEGIAGEGN